MVGVAERERERLQGSDERPAQQADAHDRILAPRDKDAEKQAIIDRINQNRLLYRQQKEQENAERKLERPQVGLPEMERREALQEEIQASAHQNQVFKGAKATERWRMGHEQKELALAKDEHGYEINQIDANNRILEAANNPTQGKEKDLNKTLTREEKEWKAVFNNTNIPFKKKIEYFKRIIQGRNISKLSSKLNEKNQIKRGKKLMKEINPQTRRNLRRLKREIDLTNPTLNKLGRCA